jgi:hypothetical protein
LRETFFIGNFTTDLSNQTFIGDQESLVDDERLTPAQTRCVGRSRVNVVRDEVFAVEADFYSICFLQPVLQQVEK